MINSSFEDVMTDMNALIYIQNCTHIYVCILRAVPFKTPISLDPEM